MFLVYETVFDWMKHNCW